MHTQKIKSTVFIIALLMLGAVPWFGSAFYIELIAKTLIMGLFAMSLSLLVGHLGLISLGHALYFGVAAYAVALLSPLLMADTLWQSLLVAMAASSLVAFVLGPFVLRTKGVYFIMVTLAFGQLFYYLFHDTALGGGSDGIYLNARPPATIWGWRIFDVANTTHFFYFIMAIVLAAYLTLKRLLASPLGLIFSGIHHNEARMQSLGYRVFLYKWLAVIIAGALAGLAGGLYAMLFGFITPEFLAWHQSGNVLLMVIVGGIGHLLGAFLGAFFFVLAQEILSMHTTHWLLWMGMLIVAVVLFMPGGLAALPARVNLYMRSRWLRLQANQAKNGQEQSDE